MVVGSLLESAFNNAENISSNDPIPGLSPTKLLETFVPGYSLIHKFLLFAFGFDVTILVSLGVVLWLGARIFRLVWAVIRDLVHNNYMAEITINKADEIYAHLLAFLAHQYKFNSSRRLIAETLSKSAWEFDSTDTKKKESRVKTTAWFFSSIYKRRAIPHLENQAKHSPIDIEGDSKWLNFANQEAKSQPRFTPGIGSHNFWHNRTYFQLKRKEVTMFDELGSGAATFKDKELLTLSCFGRSTEPIKKLIQDAKEHYSRTHNTMTMIKRPAHKEYRKRGHNWCWVKHAERPCRPLGTVVLDEERKMDILADINEYLHPATVSWYADRGIPYRRGYLLYGPPGTGKTSLTFALAGVFGLDIYVISLLDPTLTEDELEILFTNLPARCIVLLEDIDTAGLIREPSESEEKVAALGGVEKGVNELSVDILAKALQRANLPSEEIRNRISLSGLLNVIDGVASHEGRVLVMTTNHDEKLDPALIRPGRVDHKVKFENATQKQIAELFERMYTSSTKAVPNPNTNGTAAGTPVNSVAKHGEKKEDLGAEELSQIAKEFAKKVPGGVFSPAEIQGFLLKRKKEPRKALDEVEDWVEEELKKKGVEVKAGEEEERVV